MWGTEQALGGTWGTQWGTSSITGIIPHHVPWCFVRYHTGLMGVSHQIYSCNSCAQSTFLTTRYDGGRGKTPSERSMRGGHMHNSMFMATRRKPFEIRIWWKVYLLSCFLLDCTGFSLFRSFVGGLSMKRGVNGLPVGYVAVTWKICQHQTAIIKEQKQWCYSHTSSDKRLKAGCTVMIFWCGEQRQGLEISILTPDFTPPR